MKITAIITLFVAAVTTTEAAQRGLREVQRRGLNPNNSQGMGNMSSGDPDASCQSFTDPTACATNLDNNGETCCWNAMNPDSMGMGMSQVDFCGNCDGGSRR